MQNNLTLFHFQWNFRQPPLWIPKWAVSMHPTPIPYSILSYYSLQIVPNHYHSSNSKASWLLQALSMDTLKHPATFLRSRCLSNNVICAYLTCLTSWSFPNYPMEKSRWPTFLPKWGCHLDLVGRICRPRILLFSAHRTNIKVSVGLISCTLRVSSIRFSWTSYLTSSDNCSRENDELLSMNNLSTLSPGGNLPNPQFTGILSRSPNSFMVVGSTPKPIAVCNVFKYGSRYSWTV